jgi:hypothetical protein
MSDNVAVRAGRWLRGQFYRRAEHPQLVVIPEKNAAEELHADVISQPPLSGQELCIRNHAPRRRRAGIHRRIKTAVMVSGEDVPCC